MRTVSFLEMNSCGDGGSSYGAGAHENRMREVAEMMRTMMTMCFGQDMRIR